MTSPGFNQTSAERVEENKAKEPTEYLERPIVDKRLKLAQDAQDADYIRKHKNDELIPMDVVHKQLKKQNLV